jgi:hypothetical protein
MDPKEEGFPKRSARSAKIAAISLWIGRSESIPVDFWSSAVGREGIFKQYTTRIVISIQNEMNESFATGKGPQIKKPAKLTFSHHKGDSQVPAKVPKENCRLTCP